MRVRLRLLIPAIAGLGIACAVPQPDYPTDVPAGDSAVSRSGALSWTDIAVIEAPLNRSPSSAGDTPDVDQDSDGIPDVHDNCPNVANANQADADQDGLGDACENATGTSDYDGDGVADHSDNCPLVANADQRDSDGDHVGDACDATQFDDTDHDNVSNIVDNCPTVPNPDQRDSNGNGIGDACDTSPTPTATATPDPWGGTVGPSP